MAHDNRTAADIDRLVKARGLGLFDAFSAGVLFLDNDQRILWANGRAKHMLGGRGLVGDTCPSVFHDPCEGELVAEEGRHVFLEVPGDGEELLSLVFTTSRLTPEILVRIMHDISDMRRELRALRQEVRQMQEALEHIDRGPEMLAVCTECGKVHIDGDHWVEPEAVPQRYSGRGITYGCCPGCTPDFYGRIRPR